MTTRSVLVRIPGYPLKAEALFPDRMLAELAACIVEGGATARILDFGTAPVLARMVPPGTQAMAGLVADRFATDTPLSPLEVLHTLWGVRHADRVFRETRNRLCDEAAARIALEKPDCVVFAVHGADDLAAAQHTVEKLRRAGGVRWIGITGTLCETAPAEALRRVPYADGLIQADAYLHFGNCLGKGSSPFFDKTVRPPAGDDRPDLDTLPAPAYDPDLYPALAEPGAKAMLFEIEDQRGCSIGCPACGDDAGPGRTKSVRRLCEEVRWLGARHGARAFSFAESRGCSAHLEALAVHLLREGVQTGFSRRDHVCPSLATEFGMVRMAGCESVQFLVDTASQRLQEDHYGRGVTISALERLVARAREQGVFTTVRLLFPCPADDWHTFAEALRFVGRARPDSVIVRQPDLPEQSRWFREPGRFGYRDGGTALPRPTRFPLPDGRWTPPGGRPGGQSSTDAIRSQEALIAAVRGAGFATGIDERTALMARLVDGAGREQAFLDTLNRALCTGDPDALGEWVLRINRALRVPAEVGQPAAAPLRQAVGN